MRSKVTCACSDAAARTRMTISLIFICSLSTAGTGRRCGCRPERRQVADDVGQFLWGQRGPGCRHRRLDEAVRPQVAFHEGTQLLLPVDHADVERVESQ